MPTRAMRVPRMVVSRVLVAFMFVSGVVMVVVVSGHRPSRRTLARYIVSSYEQVFRCRGY